MVASPPRSDIGEPAGKGNVGHPIRASGIPGTIGRDQGNCPVHNGKQPSSGRRHHVLAGEDDGIAFADGDIGRFRKVGRTMRGEQRVLAPDRLPHEIGTVVHQPFLRARSVADRSCRLCHGGFPLLAKRPRHGSRDLASDELHRQDMIDARRARTGGLLNRVLPCTAAASGSPGPGAIPPSRGGRPTSQEGGM